MRLLSLRSAASAAAAATASTSTTAANAAASSPASAKLATTSSTAADMRPTTAAAADIRAAPTMITQARMSTVGGSALKAAMIDFVETTAMLRAFGLRPWSVAATWTIAAGLLSVAARPRILARTVAVGPTIRAVATRTIARSIGAGLQHLLAIAPTEIHPLILAADVAPVIALGEFLLHVVVVVTHAMSVIRVMDPGIAVVDIDVVVDVDVAVTPVEAAAQ